ncbi:hypothetical protein BT96DRAFT_915206, partial [Gymnopus androsaceus JB14]
LSDMVVNILSAAQASTAVLFSRPDLHPNPFEEIKYSLNNEGIPVLEGSLGALSCKLAAPPIMLDELAFADTEESRSKPNSISPSSGFTSELFIARVTKVEMLALDMGNVEPDDAQAMPLLYHRTGSVPFILTWKYIGFTKYAHVLEIWNVRDMTAQGFEPQSTWMVYRKHTYKEHYTCSNIL